VRKIEILRYQPLHSFLSDINESPELNVVFFACFTTNLLQIITTFIKKCETYIGEHAAALVNTCG